MTQGVAQAFPTEGFESYSLFKNGRKPFYTANYGYLAPIWADPYYDGLVMAGFADWSWGYLTVGAKATLNNAAWDRDGVFLKQDFLYSDDFSFALKWSHENLNFAQTSFEHIGAEWNWSYPVGSNASFYATVGYHYIWTKQKWNGNWNHMFTFNTEDHRGFAHGSLGWIFYLTSKITATFDLNNRSRFAFHAPDAMAWDATLNYELFDGWKFRILGGTRTGGFWVGTMNPTIYYTYIGLQKN